jgi:hypothetical protein
MKGRAVCVVLGVVGAPGEPLGPVVPPLIQVAADTEEVAAGDVLDVVVRVRVKKVLPVPLVV